MEQTEDVQDEADEAVVSSQREEDLVEKHNVLEVIDNTFAVEKVHCRRQPVPVQALGTLEVPSSTRYARNRNYLLERYYLDRGYYCEDVDVPHKEGEKEAANHNECPESSSDEVGLLLFIFGLPLLLGCCWLLHRA